ncbi:MAG: hypothetical protein WC028_26375 [Candidatus Obscuribacterales bacterium]
MGFFNTVSVKEKCPECGELATLDFQIKTACSSFGDANGRFAMRYYKVGETLRWWPASDERYNSFVEGVDYVLVDADAHLVRERAHGGCEKCDANLQAEVFIRDLKLEKIESIGSYQADYFVD